MVVHCHKLVMSFHDNPDDHISMYDEAVFKLTAINFTVVALFSG